MEQRVNLKFFVKVKKTLTERFITECFKLLNEVYDEDVVSRTQIFE